MTDAAPSPITPRDRVEIQSVLALLRNQLAFGRLEGELVARQIDKLDQFLARVEITQKQSAQATRFEALYQVSQMIGSSLDLQLVLDQVMDAIIRLTHAERGFLVLRGDDGEIIVQAARNFDQRTLNDAEFKFSRTVTNRVLDTGEPVLTVNAAEDPRFAGQASIAIQLLRSVMATPLRARGNVIGVAYVDSRAAAGLFNEEDLAALAAFSAQAAAVLDNARLFAATDEALNRRVEQLRQLRRVDLQLNQTLDVDQVLGYTLEWAVRLSGAAGGYAGLWENNQLRWLPSYGAVTETVPGAVVAALQRQLDETPGSSALIGWLPATLIAPIVRGEKLLGVVILCHHDDKPFDEEQIDLVERVITRAAIAIENARLYASAQAANQAKNEFIGIVAHDLKSPMAGIRGYAELLKQDAGLNAEQRQFVGQILEFADQMRALVGDLADISRIESGRFSMEEQRVPVSEVLQRLKDGAILQIEARGHTYVERIEPNLPDLWVDYHRLLQVLTNLVSNAYKYTLPGGVITVTAQRSGQRVLFSVADTGVGLSPEEKQRLGKNFWRARNRQTYDEVGTGLGFSIARSLVQMMGSHIEIESEPNRGSCFTFSIKIAPENG